MIQTDQSNKDYQIQFNDCVISPGDLIRVIDSSFDPAYTYIGEFICVYEDQEFGVTCMQMWTGTGLIDFQVPDLGVADGENYSRWFESLKIEKIS